MNYTYVNSQIKVIEEKILKRNDFLKLAKVPKNTFLKNLVDLGYGSLENSLEKMINRELSNVKEYLDLVSPNKEFTDLFFLTNDAINIKYLYKLKIFKLRDAHMFLNRGKFTEEELRLAIFENEYSNIDKSSITLFKEIEKSVKDINDPRILSGKIDAVIYEYCLNKIKLTFNEPLNAYFKTAIDFSNILSFIRIKNLDWAFNENKEMFVRGGNFKLDFIESLFTLTKEDVIRNLNPYYDEKLSNVLKEYSKNNNLNILELKLANLQLNLMRQYKDDSFGIGIIMYYYLKKLAEAKNIRYVYANPDIYLDYLLEY